MGRLNTIETFIEHLPERPRNPHKGTFGTVYCIGGNTGTAGAGLLMSRAALKSGSGKVVLVSNALDFDPVCPELMVHSLSSCNLVPDMFEYVSVIAIGPGLGYHDLAMKLLEMALETDKPLVLDADAITLLARNSSLKLKLKKRTAPSILTPHPAEAARILDVSTHSVQSDRLEFLFNLIYQTDSVVILKGAGTLIGSPCGRWVINAIANSTLATAGSGDVLTGLVASFISQNVPIFESACMATHLHSVSVEKNFYHKNHLVGLTASEMID